MCIILRPFVFVCVWLGVGPIGFVCAHLCSFVGLFVRFVGGCLFFAVANVFACIFVSLFV